MEKIAKLIEERNLKPSDCVYHTLRDLENGGKIRVLALHDNVARAEFICPKCGKYGYKEQEWKKPFSVKCDCGNIIKVSKLKGKIK